jgi:glycosyltransferase involved in cell wall biosynthesis
VLTPVFRGRDVRTTPLQRAGRSEVIPRAFLPFLPRNFAALDVSQHDTVISSSSGFAHHVRPRARALHLCYCHTPPRFLWRPEQYFYERALQERLSAPLRSRLQRLDRQAAERVDVYVAISSYIAELVKTTYGREARILHPPVDISRHTPSEQRTGRFLIVSRLLPYKRLDLAIRATTKLGVALDVVGAGPDEARLRKLAGPTVTFRGWLPDEAVREAMRSCIALIVPGAEDFGLTIVEAQASGRPPIAFAQGGALETVRDGESGFLFEKQTVASLAQAMLAAAEHELPAVVLRASAQRFDMRSFGDRLCAIVAEEHEAKARRLSRNGHHHQPEAGVE